MFNLWNCKSLFLGFEYGKNIEIEVVGWVIEYVGLDILLVYVVIYFLEKLLRVYEWGKVLICINNRRFIMYLRKKRFFGVVVLIDMWFLI